MSKFTEAVRILGLHPLGMVMLRRAADDVLPGQWEFPGGKVDHEEDHRQALERELMEEAGLRIIGELQPLATVEFMTLSGKRVKQTTYAAQVDGDPVLSHEHDAHAFVETHPERSYPGPLTDTTHTALQQFS